MRVAVVFAVSIFSAATVPAYAIETVTYYHLDALGSPVAATDEQGNLKWREDYKPYGEKIRNEAAASSNTRAYTGHPHDNDTGLTYAGARYYDPVVGRFMGIDPVGISEVTHSFNRYAYVYDNPYRYVDPDGKRAKVPKWLREALERLTIDELAQEVVMDFIQDEMKRNLADERARDIDKIRKQLELTDEALDYQDRIVMHCDRSGGGAACWEQYDKDRGETLARRERWREDLKDRLGEDYPSRREYLDDRNQRSVPRDLF